MTSTAQVTAPVAAGNMAGAGDAGTRLNAMAPAAGGTMRAVSRGGAGQPGVGIDNKVDVTTMPGNSYDRTLARFSSPGTASAPVDGKPLVTNTLADGRRISDPSLNDIAPAAGDAASTPTAQPAVVQPQRGSVQAGTRDSLQAQTRPSGGPAYNN